MKLANKSVQPTAAPHCRYKGGGISDVVGLCVGYGSEATYRAAVCLFRGQRYKMIMPIHPTGYFTPQAEKRWKKIPQWAQEKILANVFCGKCCGSVPIVLEKAKMKNKDLILMGTCKNCGKKICRVVEPEGE